MVNLACWSLCIFQPSTAANHTLFQYVPYRNKMSTTCVMVYKPESTSLSIIDHPQTPGPILETLRVLSGVLLMVVTIKFVLCQQC